MDCNGAAAAAVEDAVVEDADSDELVLVPGLVAAELEVVAVVGLLQMLLKSLVVLQNRQYSLQTVVVEVVYMVAVVAIH